MLIFQNYIDSDKNFRWCNYINLGMNTASMDGTILHNYKLLRNLKIKCQILKHGLFDQNRLKKKLHTGKPVKVFYLVTSYLNGK